MIDDDTLHEHRPRSGEPAAGGGRAHCIDKTVIDDLPERFGVLEGEVELVAQFMAAEFDGLFAARLVGVRALTAGS